MVVCVFVSGGGSEKEKGSAWNWRLIWETCVFIELVSLLCVWSFSRPFSFSAYHWCVLNLYFPFLVAACGLCVVLGSWCYLVSVKVSYSADCRLQRGSHVLSFATRIWRFAQLQLRFKLQFTCRLYVVTCVLMFVYLHQLVLRSILGFHVVCSFYWLQFSLMCVSNFSCSFFWIFSLAWVAAARACCIWFWIIVTPWLHLNGVATASCFYQAFPHAFQWA